MLIEYDVLYDTLETTGHAQKLNIINNAASTELKKLLQKIKIGLQLVPPHIHRIKVSERAICTF